MPFTGFYQPVPELKPITPTVNPLQAEFHKMAQDFIENTQKQQQLNVAKQQAETARQEQAVANLNAQSQRQLAVEKAKAEKQKAQEDIRERESEAKAQRAVLAAKEATPDMSEYDSQIMGADIMAGFGYPKPLSEVRKHFVEQSEVHRKTDNLKAYNQIRVALKQTPYTQAEFDAIKDVASTSLAPENRLIEDRTGKVLAESAVKPMSDQEQAAARLALKQTTPGKNTASASSSSAKQTGVRPNFLASLAELKRGKKPAVSPGMVSEAPSVPGFPTGTGMGPAQEELTGFGVSPDLGVVEPTQPNVEPPVVQGALAQQDSLIESLLDLNAADLSDEERRILAQEISFARSKRSALQKPAGKKDEVPLSPSTVATLGSRPNIETITTALNSATEEEKPALAKMQSAALKQALKGERSDEAMKMLYKQYVSGGITRREIAARDKEGATKFDNYVADRMKIDGTNYMEPFLNAEKFGRYKGTLGFMEKKSAVLNSFVDNLQRNIRVTRDYLQKAGANGPAMFNKVSQAIVTNAGVDPDLAALKMALRNVAIETSNIMSNPNMVGTTSEKMQSEMLAHLSSARNLEELDGVLKLIEKETQSRVGSQHDTLEAYEKGLRDLGYKNIKFTSAMQKPTLPFEKDKTKRVVGQVYETPRGPAMWKTKVNPQDGSVVGVFDTVDQ